MLEKPRAISLSPSWGHKLGDVAVGRDNNFNLIRVLAASGVIFSHAYPLGLGQDVAEPLETILKGDNLGRLCVFIFFATSGYFIATSFDRRASLAGYVWARVLRIFPALIVMLAVMLPLIGVITAQGIAYWKDTPVIFANNVLMFTSFGKGIPKEYVLFPGNPFSGTFNGSLWTLYFEVLCYAGTAIAGFLGILRNRNAALVTLILAIAAFYAVPHLTGRTTPRMLSYVGLPFAFGATAYVWRAWLVLDGKIALGLLAFAAAMQPTPLFFPAMIAATVYTTLWLGYLDVPALKGFNRHGDYSYGIYIYAFPIQQILIWAGLREPYLQTLAAFFITFIFAMASWHIVEKPALGIRKWLAARPDPDQVKG